MLINKITIFHPLLELLLAGTRPQGNGGERTRGRTLRAVGRESWGRQKTEKFVTLVTGYRVPIRWRSHFQWQSQKTFLRVPETNGRLPTYLILPWVNQTDTNSRRLGDFSDSPRSLSVWKSQSSQVFYADYHSRFFRQWQLSHYFQVISNIKSYLYVTIYEAIYHVKNLKIILINNIKKIYVFKHFYYPIAMLNILTYVLFQKLSYQSR